MKSRLATMWSDVSEKLGQVIDRWGLQVFFAFALIYLLVPLGRTGLWEPWEMDRADVAKTFHESALVPTVLAPESEKLPLAEKVVEAADAVGVRLDYQDVSPATRRKAVELKPVTDALQKTRTHVVGGVLVDLDLAVRAGHEKVDAEKLAPHLDTALKQANNASIILISSNASTQLEEHVRSSYEKVYWDEVAKRYCFTCKGADKDNKEWERELFVNSMKERGDFNPPMERLVVLLQPSTQEIQEALSESSARVGSLALFKRDGVSLSLPPLEIWGISVAYNIFGYTEFATRLPGAIFGLLTLFLLVWIVRRVWDSKVALAAGCVLLTTPLFYAQAMSAVGETGGMLGLTLIALGLILYSREEERPSLTWSLIGAGLLVAFLAKGLFALLVASVLALSVPALHGGRTRAAWFPALVIGAVFGVLTLIVQDASSTGFWGQFRFTQKLFSSGPDAYHMNFDLIVNQIGFGAFPWSPIYLFALASIIFSKQLNEERNLILVVWFGVATTMLMLALSDFNQFLWPAAPAASVLVGLFLVRMSREGVGSALAAFVLVLMALILARELGKSPKPLAAFLAFDPPFKDKGAERFPEDIKLSKMAILFYAAAIGLLVLHFTRLWSRTEKLRAFFRRAAPFAIALGATLSVFGLALYLRAKSMAKSAMESRQGEQLSDEVRQYIDMLAGSGDTGVQLATPLILAVLLLGLLKLIPNISAVPKALDKLPGVGWLSHGAAKIWNRRFWILKRDWPNLPLVGLICWVGLSYFALATVGTPEDYWSSAIGTGLVIVFLLCAAAVAGTLFLKSDRLPSVNTVAIYAGAIASFALGSLLLRDALHFTWFGLGLTWVGALALGQPIAKKMIQDWTSYAWIGGLLVMGAFLVLTGPVVSHFDAHASTLGHEELTKRLSVGSKMAWGFVGLALVLILNRYWGDRLRKPSLWMAWFERGTVAASATVLVALVLGVTTVFGFYKDVSLDVSQKHVIDTYREAEGLASNELGERIFRYGTFAAAGKKDSNFYTSAIPTITDRNLALNVLLAEKDQLVTYKSAGGKREVRLVQGWNPSNDKDGDGNRDHQTYVGRISGVEPGVLKAESDAFEGVNLAGNLLLDARLNRFNIESNDASTVELRDLELVHTPDKGAPIRRGLELNKPLVAGNGIRVGLRIPADVTLERRHAEFGWKDGSLTLKDLGSKGGTFLNGKRIQEAALKKGDEIKIGRSKIVVAGRTPSALRKAPGENFFRIDHPEAPDHEATSMTRERSYLLLPANSFGDINFRFRKMAKGRHIPVLSGESIRVALAGSYFREGESQENRYAKLSYSRSEFDKLAAQDPKIKAAPPGSYFANFEDKVHVIGYRLEESSIKTGKKMKLRLYFECVAKLKNANEGCTGTTSYQIYMHIEHHKTKSRINGDHWPSNLTSGGEKDKDCTGCYQTNHWLPGDVIVDMFEREIPTGTTSGTQDMWFGFYRKGKTPSRLKIFDEKGKQTRDFRNKKGSGCRARKSGECEPTGVLIGSFQLL